MRIPYKGPSLSKPNLADDLTVLKYGSGVSKTSVTNDIELQILAFALLATSLPAQTTRNPAV